MTHTPGPWTVDGLAVDSAYVEIAVVSEYGKDEDDNKLDRDTLEANARLIAAAPEMYETLQSLQPWIAKAIADGLGSESPTPLALPRLFQQATNLIAKAEGKDTTT